MSRARLMVAALFALGASFGLGVMPVAADSSTVTVTAVSPNRGDDSGGDTITLKGTGFWCNTGGQTVQDPATGNNDPNPNDYLSVMFGSNAATVNQVDNDGQMEVTDPSGEGTVDVTVECVQGATSTSAKTAQDRFTYINTVSGAAANPNAGVGGGSSDLGSPGGSSGPSSLAQTGGGPGARPVANRADVPLWLALSIVPLAAAAVLFRRRLGRR